MKLSVLNKKMLLVLIGYSSVAMANHNSYFELNRGTGFINGPNISRPPNHQPPPNRSYSNCKIEYTGSYYYVSRNGQRITDLKSNLNQALNDLSYFENSNYCGYSPYSPGSCTLEYSGSYYYVNRNNSRISEFTSNYLEALRTRDLLYQYRNCDENTYYPNLSCSINYTGSYYYVARGNSRISEFFSNQHQATNLRNDLIRNYVCNSQRPNSVCRLEYSGSYYYISSNGGRITEFYSVLNQALQNQNDLARQGICLPPNSNEVCRIEYTGSYYYVARNGSRLSEFFSNVYNADQVLYNLRSSRNCY